MTNAKRIISLLLISLIVLPLAACGAPARRCLSSGIPSSGGDGGIAPGGELKLEGALINLSASVDVGREAAAALTDKQLKTSADFAFALLSGIGAADENALISPLSVMMALGMAANGAWGNTRDEMEDMLGMSVEELNTFINSITQSLKNTDGAALLSANSAWLGSGIGFGVREDYLESIGRYYGAEIISADFSKEETLGEINGWVNKNTDGMIKRLLDELDKQTVCILINALTFDAEWKVPFSGETGPGEFKNSDGSRASVDMMHTDENRYISGAGCTGFIKSYGGDNYSYVALLPDTDDIDKFLASLDGDTFLSLIKNAADKKVSVTMPKYSLDYSLSLTEPLAALGMKSAFNPDLADFSALGSIEGKNIYLSRALHKTHITLDESGTRAAAVTALILEATSAAPAPNKSVTLDRPFVYAIIDNATLCPVFLGVLEKLEK